MTDEELATSITERAEQLRQGARTNQNTLALYWSEQYWVAAIRVKGERKRNGEVRVAAPTVRAALEAVSHQLDLIESIR